MSVLPRWHITALPIRSIFAYGTQPLVWRAPSASALRMAKKAKFTPEQAAQLTAAVAAVPEGTGRRWVRVAERVAGGNTTLPPPPPPPLRRWLAAHSANCYAHFWHFKYGGVYGLNVVFSRFRV